MNHIRRWLFFGFGMLGVFMAIFDMAHPQGHYIFGKYTDASIDVLCGLYFLFMFCKLSKT